MEDYSKRDIVGLMFFALGVWMLIYMFISPLNHIIVHIDEYFTMTLTSLPINDIITITSWDVHPPLHYLLGKIVVKLASMLGIDRLFALKILSIIPYAIILAVSATKIKDDYGWLTAGIFAFALAVMSEFFTHYLIIRMYSWAILFVLLAFISFKEILETSDKKYWIMLTVFSVLCAYTHYFAAMSAGCIYLLLLAYIYKFNRQEIKMWAASVAGAVILYIPWILSLANQLTRVHDSYWIPQVNLQTFINSLGYYAYNNDVVFSLVAIIVLAVILYIYTQQNDIKQKDQFFILSGVGVYFGTIILGILLSVIFKPILMVRYLLPATVTVWFAISIILSRIKGKKMILISFALIGLLMVSGFATVLADNNSIFEKGTAQKQIMDEIAKDNNSMVIVTSQNMIMYFLDYANETDMYCLNVGHVFGDSMERLQKLYDFKTYNGTDIDKLIANNTDKNIYIIGWNEVKLNSTVDELHRDTGIVFYKVKMANVTVNSTDEVSEENY